MFSTTRATTAAAFSSAFAGAGLREVYLDLPGHGDSPGTGQADSQTILGTVCSWLESHLDGPALLAGASYGAPIWPPALPANGRCSPAGYCLFALASG